MKPKNPNIDQLAQNVLMECNGDANYALRVLAARVLTLNDYAERLEDKSSFGFHRWLPRKPHKPLVLDSFEPLELAEERSPGLAEGR
jgi:hypothetical protein